MKHILHAAFALFASASIGLSAPIEVQQITENVYALVGPTTQRDPDNLGNNSTHGLVITSEGAVLIDAGGSYKGAEALDGVIKTLTDQPVTYVINTGGQDHRWIGNSYWANQGATIIASNDAVADQTDRQSMQLTILSTLLGQDGVSGTNPRHADVTFDTDYTLTLGDTALEITHLNGAHTPGDSFVWHATSGTVFTGDIVYIGRILGVMEFSNTLNWLESFDAFAALNPAHVVPGHGPVTDLATATHDTRDYLANLREKIGAHIEDGGDIIGAPGVDQSAFAYLGNFDQLAGRNAQTAFEHMEWE